MTEQKSLETLLTERDDSHKNSNNAMSAIYSERLTKVFSTIYSKSDIAIVWEEIDRIAASPKLVNVKGKIALTIGEKIVIGDNEIVIDENNKTMYNKYAQYVFPLNMLEHASVEEIHTYINKINSLANSVSVSELNNTMNQEYDEFAEKLLNDASRLESATKPKTVAGFSTEGLTDYQIRVLTMYGGQLDNRVIN